MVSLTPTTQSRLAELARHHLGNEWPAVFHQASVDAGAVGFDKLAYLEVPRFLVAIHHLSAALMGRETAARVLEVLRPLAGAASPPEDPVVALTAVLGPSASVIYTTLTAKAGVNPDDWSQEARQKLACAAQEHIAGLLGEPVAKQMAEVLDPPANIRSMLPKGTVVRAVEALGEEVAVQVTALCKRELRRPLDDLDAAGVTDLIRVIGAEGARGFGEENAARFVATLRQAMGGASPRLQAQLVDLIAEYLGPMAREFLEDVCLQHGVPLTMLDFEHLMWLAEVLRAEAGALVGNADADRLARSVRALVTGRS